jgi:hypothetical protein
MPEYYYENSITDILISENYDNSSGGYTHRSGQIQIDDCLSCDGRGGSFWHSVGTVIHENAHNLEDIEVPAGNYCVESGTCYEVTDDTLGIDLMIDYLAENEGIEFSPTGLYIDNSSLHFDKRAQVIQSEDSVLAFFDEEDNAFTNRNEFYAELLSEAILQPERMAEVDPDLYAIAVIINGFETETYIDEFGRASIRRKVN